MYRFGSKTKFITTTLLALIFQHLEEVFTESPSSVCTARSVDPRSQSLFITRNAYDTALSYDVYGSHISHYSSDKEKEPNHNLVKINHDECFVAAVFEHVRVDFPKEMQRGIDSNLDAYSRAANIASKNGASVIVTPEDGIFYGSRGSMLKWEEIIPEPKRLTNVNNNPCLHTSFYKDNPILRRLSCIARNNSIYFVSNYGTKQRCTRESVSNHSGTYHEEFDSVVTSDKCPENNFFQYNTDVIFGPDGSFLAKYHKANMFIEPFDKAPQVEHIFLNTPFGKLGIFTCFDIMFKSPAIELVEDHFVDTILFPTWWFDALPSLTAIQFQEAWSTVFNVNLLAANIHQASTGSVGSGIYSGAGGPQVYISIGNNRSQLLMASIPKKAGKNRSASELQLASSKCRASFKPRLHQVYWKDWKEDKKPYAHSDSLFVHGQDIVVRLNKTSDNIIKCVDDFCCSLSYDISKKGKDFNAKQDINRLVMRVRNGLRPGQFPWWEQVCSLATLADPKDTSNITKDRNFTEENKFALEGLFEFKHLELSANFGANYVYPIMAHNISLLVANDKRRVTCKPSNNLTRKNQNECTLTYNGTGSKPLLVATLYGRLYQKDEM